MAKTKVKRPSRDEQIHANVKKIKLVSSSPLTEDNIEPKTLQDVKLTQDDIDICIDALEVLAENPSVIKSKACKDLRTAVFHFRNACTTGAIASVDSNLTSRISGALADENHVEARILLSEMRIRGQSPKLGALCRWVRDLDVVSGLAEQLSDIGAKRCSRETESLKVLDAILRVVGPVDYTSPPLNISGQPLAPQKAWDLRDMAARVPTYARVLDRTIFPPSPEHLTSQFRAIETTPGINRKPPNLHPAVLYTSSSNAIPLAIDAPNTTHHTHPVVPNLHLLKDALSPEECNTIIAAAELIGFTPDAPIRAPGEEASVLAHNFYWVVDTSFCARLWDRVEKFVPATVHGKKVRGLNRRFRVYRYVPGAEYRAHIDGAWPPSSVDPNDKYIYDASPPGQRQTSLFTFLIYLNDEFESGETTFFLPSSQEGTLNAYPVKPLQGSVAMFPHGETEGSLLHEGTGVCQTSQPSAKYVIRTDVLYDAIPST